MVVVTDGESHDEDIRDSVIAECESQGITRFGIAVSNQFLSNHTYSILLAFIYLWFLFKAHNSQGTLYNQ